MIRVTGHRIPKTAITASRNAGQISVLAILCISSEQMADVPAITGGDDELRRAGGVCAIRLCSTVFLL